MPIISITDDKLKLLNASLDIVESSLAIASDCLDRGYEALAIVKDNVEKYLLDVYALKAEDLAEDK
jgi:hypothetical protein